MVSFKHLSMKELSLLWSPFQFSLHIIFLWTAKSSTHCSQCVLISTLFDRFSSKHLEFFVILSCTLGDVSQGTHKATSLSPVSSSVEIFFGCLIQKISAIDKLQDHDLSFCQILLDSVLLFTYFLFFFFFLFSWNWNEHFLVPYSYTQNFMLTKSCLKSKVYEDCGNTT